MKRQLLIIGFAIILSITFSCKKEPPKPIWSTFTKSDGLASDTITCITADAHGNVWFGHENSKISKFDGKNWTKYTKYTDYPRRVNSIAIDALDNIWIAVTDWVSKFDGTNWTTCISLRDSTLSPIYDIRYVLSVKDVEVDNQNNIWVSICSYGLLKFDGSNWTTFFSDGYRLSFQNVWSMAVDSKNNIWFASQDGTTRFDGTHWFTYNSDLAFINSIAIDSHDNVWFGTNGGGLIKFDGTNTTVFTMLDGLPSNLVGYIGIDKQDTKWITTGYGSTGIWKFNGKNWILLTTLDGLVDNNITSFAVDSKGDKWFGTNRGVTRLHDN